MGQCHMAAGTVAAFCKVAGTATAENKTRIRIVLIKVFLECKIESIETILSKQAHTHAHARTYTHEHTDYTKLNLHKVTQLETGSKQRGETDEDDDDVSSDVGLTC